MFRGIKKWGRRLKAESLALYLAYRDPRTPWMARAVMALVLAYLVSPIDLIPDFIPIFGQLDDIVLIPLGIALANKLTPSEVWNECRQKARWHIEEKAAPNRRAAAVIIAMWAASALVLGFFIVSRFYR